MHITTISVAEERAIRRHWLCLCTEHGQDVDIEFARKDWDVRHAVKWRMARQARMLALEREEILRHKWIESEKAHRDLGAEAVFDWIQKYAATWRDWYEQHVENEEEIPYYPNTVTPTQTYC